MSTLSVWSSVLWNTASNVTATSNKTSTHLTCLPPYFHCSIIFLWLSGMKRSIKWFIFGLYCLFSARLLSKPILILQVYINTFWSSNTIWPQGTLLALVQAIACQLLGSKPLPEPMLTSKSITPPRTKFINLKFETKYKTFHPCISKCCMQNNGHFRPQYAINETSMNGEW